MGKCNYLPEGTQGLCICCNDERQRVFAVNTAGVIAPASGHIDVGLHEMDGQYLEFVGTEEACQEVVRHLDSSDSEEHHLPEPADKAPKICSTECHYLRSQNARLTVKVAQLEREKAELIKKARSLAKIYNSFFTKKKLNFK